MSRDLKLDSDVGDVQGKFWFPGKEDERFSGVIQLKTGNNPHLKLLSFVEASPALQLMRALDADEGPGYYKRVILGHDNHGNPVTLIDCVRFRSNSTMALVEEYWDCQAAIFGVSLPTEDLFFSGIQLQFDNQNAWVENFPFGGSESWKEEGSTETKLLGVKIPIKNGFEIPLNIQGYQKSKFEWAWSIKTDHDDFHLESYCYLELSFVAVKNWREVLTELRLWRQFFSLAMRSPIQVRSFSVYRDDCYVFPGNPAIKKPLSVWIARESQIKKSKERLTRLDFHFSYNDISMHFSDSLERWIRIQSSWEAVISRFFSIAEPRSLYINERFLFLAQAVESLHRSRSGGDGAVDMGQAAKEAWLASPPGLQELLGARGQFVRKLVKTRNYYTHYGKPGPDEDGEILEGRELAHFSANLRFLIEAAIMQEIGMPEKCVAKVWHQRWRPNFTEFA